jgi:hypothetical protein
MVSVNRAPHNQVPPEWAFHPTIGPFIRDLLNVVWQLRNKTGGDADYITEIQGDFIESESPINYDIRGLISDRDKYNAERLTERKVRSLESENAQLKAEMLTMRRQMTALSARLNQFIAEIETNA